LRLQSIELYGFKSFPDKTILNFNQGVTAVVGPNGSGKSNISDAVRWVLGELSSKSIRGSKMEDVIFNGTDKRKPMNFAEVSLTIDNTDPESRMNIDYDTVTVTRRYFRNGDSEYLINRKPVRLRDINELFMNTGVGRDGYSIISQGKAAEIISQKSEERRHVFEEAAGIAKYRYQKADCEKKLGEVDDNITRISDITSEVESRLEPLEKDSRKARQYMELFEEKKRIDVSLWLYDTAALRTKLTTSQKSLSIAKHELEIADDSIAAHESQTEKLFLSSQDKKLKYEQHDRKINEYTKRQYDLTSDIKLIENDISHIESQIKQLEADLKLKNEAHSISSEKLKKDSERLAKLKAELETLTEKHEKATSEFETLKSSLDTEADNAEFCERRISASESKQSELRLKLSSLEGSERTGAERREAINSELTTLNTSSEQLMERMRRSDKAVKDYTDAAEKIETSISSTTAERDSLSKTGEQLTNELSRVRLDISSKRQRIETLRRMEELLEGYVQSVRFVMNASAAGKLSGICGPVSRVIEVPSKYAVAIETALGANIQNIITEDENAAKAAIAHLKANNAGRATFYPLTSMKPMPLNININDLSGCAGYVGIASELAKYDDRYRVVIEYMLGRTVVFDNLDNATLMAKKFGYRVRVVTLDGQLINAGGSFTGGSVKRDSGMLTRSTEIERAESEITRLRVKEKALSEQLSESDAKSKELENEISALDNRLSMIKKLMNAESTQYQVLGAQLDGDTKRIESLNEELSKLDESKKNTDNERDELSASIEELGKSIKNDRDELAKINERRTQLRKKHELCLSEINSLLIKLTSCKKDVDSAEDSLRLSTSALETLSSQITACEQQIYENNAKIIEKRNDIEKNRLDAEALGTDIKTLTEERAVLLSETREIELSTQKLRDELRELSHSREKLFVEYTRLENEVNTLNSEVDKLVSKLWDEYELTLSKASELGYPSPDESTRAEFADKSSDLRNKLKALGPVNLTAIDEYKSALDRFNFYTKQLEDLRASRSQLSAILNRLEEEMKQRFTEAIDEINLRFGDVFRELFGGGDAEISLSDPTNVLECGIDINVAPPGKIIKSLSLLSGGEQSFVAIALFFAILKVNPTPFCILDEIEAALDEVNVVRFAEYAKRYSLSTQFILITHRRGSMESADRLYGVTMYERGISKVLTLDVGEVEAKLGVKL